MLAEAAREHRRSWSTSPGTRVGTELLVAGLLIYAGADLHALDRWFQEGRGRAGWRRPPRPGGWPASALDARSFGLRNHG